MLGDTNKLKLQINGTDVSDYKFANPNFHRGSLVLPHLPTGTPPLVPTSSRTLFCLETGKLQPTGNLNFSRLDSARIVNDTLISADDIYAVNYNILRIENGMGGLLYSN